MFEEFHTIVSIVAKLCGAGAACVRVYLTLCKWRGVLDGKTAPGDYRHSDDGLPKMVGSGEPERSDLYGREHRKRTKPPFAGGQG